MTTAKSARERIEQWMREAVEEKKFRGLSAGAFRHKLLSSGDAAAIWELFADYQTRAIDELYDRTVADIRKEQQAPAAVLNTMSPAVPNRLSLQRQPPVMSQSVVAAMGEIINRVYLRTFMVNGRPIGEVTAREAREWGLARDRDAKFVALLTHDLSDDVIIGQARTDEEAEKCWMLADGEKRLRLEHQ